MPEQTQHTQDPSATVLTHAELAAQDFKPWTPPTREELGKWREILENLHQMVQLAHGVMGKSKPELIESLLKADAGHVATLVKRLARERETAQELVKLLDAAECRLMIAMANIYPDRGNL